MVYKVEFVADDRMPDGHDFMFCEAGKVCVLYFRESFHSLPPEAMARVLEGAWAGFLGLAEARGIPLTGLCGPRVPPVEQVYGAVG